MHMQQIYDALQQKVSCCGDLGGDKSHMAMDHFPCCINTCHRLGHVSIACGEHCIAELKQLALDLSDD